MPYLKVQPLSESEKAHGAFLKANMPYISGEFVGWVRVKLPGSMQFEMKCWVLDSGSLLNVTPAFFNNVISKQVNRQGDVKIGVCTSDSKSPWSEKKQFPMVIGCSVQTPPAQLEMRAFYIGAERLKEYFNTDGTIWSVKAAVLNNALILEKKQKYHSFQCIP